METTKTYPEFKFNSSFPTAASITKFAGTSHGLTLAAISVVDKPNTNLEIEIVCSGPAQVADYADQLRCILQKSKIIKVYFRSVKIEGVFQDSYSNLTLEPVDGKPISNSQFSNKVDVICDIDICGDNQTWKLWRLAEPNARVLKLTTDL